MNDRFKFRVWDEEMQRYCIDNHHLSLSLSGTLFNMGNGRSENYVLEQCTGLKDYNKTLIYEGDIVEYWHPDACNGEHTRHVIVWGDDYPAFDLKPILLDECNSLQYATEVEGQLVIVGNIWENGELLDSSHESD